MKNFWPLLSFLLFLSFSVVFAEGEREPDERRGFIVEDEGDTMTKLIEEVEGLKPVVESCRASTSVPSPTESKADCIWRVLNEDANANIKDQVISLMETSGKEDAPDGSPQYNYNQGNFKKKKSESIGKLEEYLRGRLREALYGESPNQAEVKGIPNHDKFYELYKSQLGRNLITQLSSYCLYSDPASGFVPVLGKNPSGEDKKKIKFYKTENMKSLSQLSANNQSAAFGGFNKCIQRISGVCAGDEFKQPNGQPIVKFPTWDSFWNPLTDDQKAAVAVPDPMPLVLHPCELNRYMTGVKQSLQEVEGLIETMRGTEQSTSLQINNRRNKEELNTDDIVNIGSKELVEASGYAEAVAEENTLLEQCQQDPDAPDCANYLSNEEDNQNIEEEFIVRGLALKAKLERDLTGDDVEVEAEQFAAYFKERGVSDENFAKILADAEAKAQATVGTNDEKTTVQILKEMISKRYDNERKALQDSLNARLAETERVIEVDPSSPQVTNESKLRNIKARIESSPEELATLYHYSNVVSSFFEVSGGSETTTNTRALAAELENNYFEAAAPGRGTASNGPTSPSNLDDLREFADPGGSDAENTSLNASDVDKIQFGIRDDPTP